MEVNRLTKKISPKKEQRSKMSLLFFFYTFLH